MSVVVVGNYIYSHILCYHVRALNLVDMHVVVSYSVSKNAGRLGNDVSQ